MSKKARVVQTLSVAVVGKVLDEADLRWPSGLRESVHVVTNFEVDEASAFHAIEVISFHDFVGDHFDADADVIISGWR